MGSFALWAHKRTQGPGFAAGSVATDGGLVAGGAAKGVLHLQAFAVNGTRLWERGLRVPGLTQLASVRLTSKGYAALGTAADRGWLGFLSPQGDLTRSRDLGPGPAQALAPHGPGWAASVGGDLLILNAKGAVRVRRAYFAGTPHAIEALAPTEDGALLAAGWLEDGREAHRAWIGAFDGAGDLLWQRPFGPGALTAVAPLGRRYVVALGTSGDTALVLAVKRGTGETVWARTLAAPGWSLAGVDLAVGPGGVLRLLLAAKGPDPHAWVVTLAPRGGFLSQQSHRIRGGGHPAALVGDVFLGTSGGQPWAVGLAPLLPWQDPCR